MRRAYLTVRFTVLRKGLSGTTRLVAGGPGLFFRSNPTTTGRRRHAKMSGGINSLTFPAAKGAGAAVADRGEGWLGMSERGSTDGGRLESIYNLMPKPKEEKKRPPMYKGKAYCSTEIAYSTLDQSKAEGRIYGIKDGRSNDPNQFLRCGEGIEARRKAGKQSELPRLEQHSRGGGSGKVEGVSGAKHGPQVLPTRRKPPVPGRDERPTMGLVSDKNFLTANAMDAILAVPVNRQRPPVDYLAKEDYGRVPEYLGHVKKEIRAENEMVEEFVREQMGISSTTEDEAPEIPRQEQEELVGQLKAKWDNVNARYQQLAHHTFFEHGRLKAKARLEGELDEIEAYIAKLTRGPVTVVP